MSLKGMRFEVSVGVHWDIIVIHKQDALGGLGGNSSRVLTARTRHKLSKCTPKHLPARRHATSNCHESCSWKPDEEQVNVFL